jgi:hypothetical protein
MLIKDWVDSGGASSVVKALWDLADKAIQNTIVAAMKAGLTVAEAIDRVRQMFSNNSRVTDITGGAPSAVKPSTVPAQPQTVPQYYPPIRPSVTAPPSIAETTAGGFRPPHTSLLAGGGNVIANGGPTGIAAAGGAAALIPTITLANADGTEAATAMPDSGQNPVVVSAAAVTAAAIAVTGQPPNNDDCDDLPSVTYKRPKGFRKGVRDTVWDYAKGKDGLVRDPLTGRVIDPKEPWHMGHRPGFEYRKHQASAESRGISRKQFLDEHNDPLHYWPELPSSNECHAGEDATDAYYGP